MLQWSALCFRRSLPLALIFFVWLAFAPTVALWSQETTENSAAATIQGKVLDEDGIPVEGARISYSSQSGETRGTTRSAKDGSYVTEHLPPAVYSVHVDGQDMLSADTDVTVTAGAPAITNFKLDWINPGPPRLESHFAGDAPENLPINGRNYLTSGEIFPAVQAVDGAIYAPGKSGTQSLSIDSSRGRTTHFDADEVEIMDETKGGASMNLPAEGVREVTVSRVTPEPFQSLNAMGSVRATTRAATFDEWHGNLYGNLREQFLGLAGFPSGNSDYSRQQYGFGAGGAVIHNKAFLYVSGERSKQDGTLPMPSEDLILPSSDGSPLFNSLARRSAFFRENLLLARLDYNVSENMKFFVRLGYDNAGQIGPNYLTSNSAFHNQINVPSVAFGLDWNHGRFVNSVRFGYQKLVDAVTPDLAASVIDPLAPFHLQLGSFALGPSNLGPRQTVQRDLFARYDSSTKYGVLHTLRFGAAVHRIGQGDYFAPGGSGPSVTSSNGLATLQAINGDPNLFPLYAGDPRGAADDPLNYPVGTFTIYNGLGNFSENSGFNRPTGAHYDTRFEGYVADTYNALPNLNVTVGVNYVLDTGRTDSDLSSVPCSAINTDIVTSPPCTGTSPILNLFGQAPPFGIGGQLLLGQTIRRPYDNVAPQLGLAWDPGHNGRTVVRVSGGLFYDNFLLQNTYQDRINRLSNGQYNRSLTLCPTGSVLFPDSAAVGHPDIVTSADGLDIATQICGQPLGATLTGSQGSVQVAKAIQDLQSQFEANQATVTSGPNVYSLANSVANFGGMLAPTFKTPRVVHMSAGIERQMGLRSMFSVDYVRELGTQFPLGIDSNHVGDSAYLTDGQNPNAAMNTYAAELSAINSTLASNPTASANCQPATSAGGSSQAAVQCYITYVPGASIVDFARNGLDSSNAFCGPFPCSVLGKQQAAFGGINPAVGSNIMYFPSGRSQYQGIHFLYHTSSGLMPARRIRKVDVTLSYTLSRYRTNIAAPDGSGGDYSTLSVAEDYNRPHLGHFGSSGLDRTHQIAITPTFELPRGPQLSLITLLGSPLPLSVSIPQMDGGGVAGEIFRSDITGDGTVGDLLPDTNIGSPGKYKNNKLNGVITNYNRNFAGRLTPAGQDLVNAQLFSTLQLKTLGAYAPLISSCTPPTPSCGLPGRAAQETWLKTLDLRFSWPFAFGEHMKIEPNISVFNAFNLANFGGPGGQLSGILDGAPGTSLNNSTSPGVCGNSTAFCTSRLDRVLPGSGTYANGAPRQMEFGVRVTF